MEGVLFLWRDEIMFNEKNQFKAFESKVWLSSPTMHGDEIEYVKEAYETNWMSTVGANINEYGDESYQAKKYTKYTLDACRI